MISGPVARVRHLSHRYNRATALQDIDLDLPAGCFVALVGPDGVGKSTLLAILAGARKVQTGRADVLGGAISDARHRRAVCARIAYMRRGSAGICIPI